VTGGHQVEQVSRDTVAERSGSTDNPGVIDRFEPDPGVALISTGVGSALELALDGLEVAQTKASPGTPLPGSPVWIQAKDSSSITGTVDALKATMTVPDGSTTTAPAVAVESRDSATVSGLEFHGGEVAALGGPAVALGVDATPIVIPAFPNPIVLPGTPGVLTGVLLDGVLVSSGLGHGFSLNDVGCLDLQDNDTSSVAGTGYVLDEVDLVDFDPTTTTVAGWLTANGNVGPPAPRFVSASDIGVCS
jgi:hypothetical protein